MGLRRARTIVATTLVALGASSTAHAAFDPAYEARNYSKMEERFRFVTGTPAYQALLREKGNLREMQVAQIQRQTPTASSRRSCASTRATAAQARCGPTTGAPAARGWPRPSRGWPGTAR